ncbi:hypothetical protein M514_07960 [Trichuris suis]|uniref:Uncharacterized protein n=1 Tax=Trichuris suis TaxID=68888 RepID=A0A085M1V0_9BILA|nr:hypothetical protein M513_07960 [Trichuris suis]KFD69400.1 hypothetical protein M514_07960 [Trichuris suis]
MTKPMEVGSPNSLLDRRKRLPNNRKLRYVIGSLFYLATVSTSESSWRWGLLCSVKASTQSRETGSL